MSGFIIREVIIRMHLPKRMACPGALGGDIEHGPIGQISFHVAACTDLSESDIDMLLTTVARISGHIALH